MAKHVMTSARKAALRKAQLASARKRRSGGKKRKGIKGYLARRSLRNKHLRQAKHSYNKALVMSDYKKTKDQFRLPGDAAFTARNKRDHRAKVHYHKTISGIKSDYKSRRGKFY